MQIKEEVLLSFLGTFSGIMGALLLASPLFPSLDDRLNAITTKIWRCVYHYPYVEIKFPEYTGERLRRCETYDDIESYLGDFCHERAARLKAVPRDDATNIVLSMDDREQVTDEFNGARFWWYSNKTVYAGDHHRERRYYVLTYHRRHHRLVHDSYIPHVIGEGKSIAIRNRLRKLYTNASNLDWRDNRESLWTHIPFKHTATFDTLAMEERKKQDIIADLEWFARSGEYYKNIGKPWKRGYLLYGPPGTGKSTMVAAMANKLGYDVYDLELTSVKDNTTLRKLLIETKSKSIIVIEDMDRSLDPLWAQRKTGHSSVAKRKIEEMLRSALGRDNKEESKVTLSGVLNFTDGLWSSCEGERIIVITTNHIEKLDPVLIRRGRMDVHVEMSYCSYEGFIVLANKYLKTNTHQSFERIRELLQEKEATPADVAEHLMCNPNSDTDIAGCLQRLIAFLEKNCRSRKRKKFQVKDSGGCNRNKKQRQQK